MREVGKGLILLGILLALIGGLMMVLPKWRVPGDIVYRGKNVTVYFPIATSLLISAGLTLLFWVISWFRR
jgi:hypothetical protein